MSVQANRAPLAWRTTLGETLAVGEVRLTPEARSLVIRWPWGGLVWSWPAAVIVEQHGQVARLPVRNVTRRAEIVVWGLSLLMALLAARRPRGNGRNTP